MMVVPYCIIINMMLPLYNLRKKEELLVLKYLYTTAYFIFLMCMPCDNHSTDAYDMYNHVLNTVLLYCTNNNTYV